MNAQQTFSEAEIAEWTRTGTLPQRNATLIRRASKPMEPKAIEAPTCSGCGLAIGSVVNRSGNDDRIVRHDLVEVRQPWALPVMPVVRNVTRGNCLSPNLRLTTLPGRGDMVWEILTVIQ